MKTKRSLLRLTMQSVIPVTAAISLLTPFAAHAQAAAFRQIFIDLVFNAYPLIWIIATIALVMMGLVMVSSSDESTLANAKTTVAAIVTGLMLTQLAPAMVRIFFAEQDGAGINNNALDVFIEIAGLAAWLETLAVIVGVTMIIISSFRAIASFGSESAVGANRTAVLHAVFGILLIGSVQVIRMVVFETREPNLLIEYIFGKLQILFGFLLLIMVAVIIFAGILLIVNLGNDDYVQRAKGIVLRAVIGLILILLSTAIITAVLSIFG